MHTVRAMTESDQEAVEAIAISTGMFPEGSWRRPKLDALDDDHHWIVAVDDSDAVTGAAYFAPETVSEGLWNTFFLSVAKQSQGSGVGRFIMTHIEEFARTQGIRTLIVETSNSEAYARARGFYQSLGYVREAEIRDYYGTGENKVVFWKSLI